MPPPRPGFVPFDERNAVRVYQRNLPHWRQDNATYFITFRLGDSIPQSVFDQWEYEKCLWLSARGIQTTNTDENVRHKSEQLPDAEQRRFHKHFNRLFHIKLDECRGACHLNRPTCRAIIHDKLLEQDGTSYHLGDFVLMPNHVHLLMRLDSSSELEWILKKIKGATSRLCNQTLGQSGRFWQPGSYDHIVRSLDQLMKYRQYIADNPSKACITLAADAVYHADWMDEWFP